MTTIMDAADLYYYHHNNPTTPSPPPHSAAGPHLDLTDPESERRQSAWERRGGNPPFRMQVVRRRRCEKRRRRYQHSEKIEVLTWLEDFRVPRRPFDSRFLREEDDIDDPDFRRPTVIEAAKYFDIPRESIMNWRKQRSRLLPSPQTVVNQPMSPPGTPEIREVIEVAPPTVVSMLNNTPPSYERTRQMLSITSLCNAPESSSPHHLSPVPAALLTPEPTPSPLISTQRVHGLAPIDAHTNGITSWGHSSYSPYSPESTPSPYDRRY